MLGARVQVEVNCANLDDSGIERCDFEVEHYVGVDIELGECWRHFCLGLANGSNVRISCKNADTNIIY